LWGENPNEEICGKEKQDSKVGFNPRKHGSDHVKNLDTDHFGWMLKVGERWKDKYLSPPGSTQVPWGALGALDH
jgi:hypothetical protein